ncbi:uncharacterized mitochondrial protein-like protein [Tanacetum coccineum]
MIDYQKLISQLEIHGAFVSKEDINQKFLRSLPPSWSQIALIMRNKPDIDEVDIDDLYNNLRVHEDKLKRLQVEILELCTAVELIKFHLLQVLMIIATPFMPQPTNILNLRNEDFQQMDEDDLEELNLRWQVAMLTVRVKKSGRSQGRRHYGDRRNAQATESSSTELVRPQDGLRRHDWSHDLKLNQSNYAFIGNLFSNSFKFFLMELLDASQVVLRAPRKDGVYNLDLKNIVPSGGITKEFSVARTPQQNGVAERKNRTLIEAARTMLADSLLPIPFWAEAVNTVCYVLNRVLVTKPQNKTPYELLIGLQVKQQPDGIFISQDKYVADILKKFDFCSIKTATTPIESNKPLVKDEDGVEVDVHEYISMIGSLMYLTASRPYIMFAVCACARFQVTTKAFHLHAVKRIFRYLKHQPKLGLWYPRDSPFKLEAFSDSDYAGASLDRKSTTGGCQFLGRRLISWQCKKQTIVANSTTKAEYVAAAHCCDSTMGYKTKWMLDYGFNFHRTKLKSI